MAFSDPIRRSSVVSAIRECDQLGQDVFLARHGFGRARRYFLDYEGRLYDSKAIVGVAHGYEYPSMGPLGPHDFSGGDATVKPKLEELGFRVKVLPRFPEAST